MRRVLRLPELVELATRPEIVERMIAELGVERTRAVLLALKAKIEGWRPDEIDLEDAGRSE
jgi:hypothetical protein